jgi:hypothetical protein
MQLYSSVSKVTGYELDDLGSIPGRNRDFLFSTFPPRYLRIGYLWFFYGG